MQPPLTTNVTFAVAVNDRAIFEGNFLESPCLGDYHGHQILVQEHFDSAAKAYNDALKRSINDLVIFCHQDVVLPEEWLFELQNAIDYLEANAPNWGVLGCSGITVEHDHWRYVYSSGLGVSGQPLPHPKTVQTLDEMILVFRKSSGLTFDETLPHFHLYGTDICLRAASIGLSNYAISAYCIHNTHQSLILPREFYQCCQHIRKTWKDSLPIQTTCIRITNSCIHVYLRRLRECYLRYIRRKEIGGTRVPNVHSLLRNDESVR